MMRSRLFVDELTGLDLPPDPLAGHEHEVTVIPVCGAQEQLAHGPGPICTLGQGHAGDHVATDERGVEISRWA